MFNSRYQNLVAIQATIACISPGWPTGCCGEQALECGGSLRLSRPRIGGVPRCRSQQSLAELGSQQSLRSDGSHGSRRSLPLTEPLDLETYFESIGMRGSQESVGSQQSLRSDGSHGSRRSLPLLQFSKLDRCIYSSRSGSLDGSRGSQQSLAGNGSQQSGLHKCPSLSGSIDGPSDNKDIFENDPVACILLSKNYKNGFVNLTDLRGEPRNVDVLGNLDGVKDPSSVITSVKSDLQNFENAKWSDVGESWLSLVKCYEENRHLLHLLPPFTVGILKRLCYQMMAIKILSRFDRITASSLCRRIPKMISQVVDESDEIGTKSPTEDVQVLIFTALTRAVYEDLRKQYGHDYAVQHCFPVIKFEMLLYLAALAGIPETKFGDVKIPGGTINDQLKHIKEDLYRDLSEDDALSVWGEHIRNIGNPTKSEDSDNPTKSEDSDNPTNRQTAKKVWKKIREIFKTRVLFPGKIHQIPSSSDISNNKGPEDKDYIIKQIIQAIENDALARQG